MADGQRLTVVQLVPDLDAGGVERGTVEVARALAAAGHRSIVVSGGGQLVSELEAHGSEHRCWPIGRKSPLALALVAKLRRLLRDTDADILHARSRLPAWIGFLAWRGLAPGAGPRFVTTAHGVYSVNRYSEIMTRGECVIAVSETVREYLSESYPRADMSRVRVIHRGVDAREFPRGHRPSAAWLERWRRDHPALEGKFVIALPGRLSRLKGHQAFLRVVADLAREGLPVHGLVVGGEALGSESYARALRARVAADAAPVTFTGHRSDMSDVYASCDLVLSLSTHPESFGRTVLEALSIGVPVIGYDHGGVGEILGEVFADGLVSPGDEDGLRDKVRAFHAARPRPPVLTSFTLQEMLARTLALYQELAAARRAASVSRRASST